MGGRVDGSPPRRESRAVQRAQLTWSADGRATFEYEAKQLAGEPHVSWRRIGSHSIFSDP